jgi:hypothetical protein
MAGYTVTFTQQHPWEKGTVLLLQRSPQTVDTLSESCKTAASWWLDKCASCIGNGFAGSDVLHATKACRRGGRENHRWSLERQIFQKGIRAQQGCDSCAVVIYDVVVGLCQSECYFYREHLSIEMQRATDDDPEDENIALWLGSPTACSEELASQIVPIFLMWTRAARGQLCKRSM